MFSALRQSESSMQMGSSRWPIRDECAKFFRDVTLGSSRLFFTLRWNYLNTLRLLKHGTRIKHWLLAYKVDDVINHQSRDYWNSELPNSGIINSEPAERRESKNWDSEWSSSGANLLPPQVCVVISEVFECFWWYSSANIPKLSLSLSLPMQISWNSFQFFFGCADGSTQRSADPHLSLLWISIGPSRCCYLLSASLELS